MLSDEEIAEINAKHLIALPKPADLLFVFGTRAKVMQRGDKAHRLWQEGYFGSTAPRRANLHQSEFACVLMCPRFRLQRDEAAPAAA